MIPADRPIPFGPEELRLLRMLRAAGERCRRLIVAPPGGNDTARAFNTSRAAMMARDIERELTVLQGETVRIIPAAMRRAYELGLRHADESMAAAGLAGSPAAGATLTMVSSERSRILLRSAVRDVSMGIDSMGRRLRTIVRDAHAIGLNNAKINRILAGGTIEGVPRNTLRRIRVDMEKVARGGMIEVLDKNGDVRVFEPRFYADMVMQTKMAEAANIATIERLDERGVRYARIIGSNSKNPCTQYVGGIYFIGDGEDPGGRYERADALPRGGPPFHPRCTKRFVAHVPELAA